MELLMCVWIVCQPIHEKYYITNYENIVVNETMSWFHEDNYMVFGQDKNTEKQVMCYVLKHIPSKF